MAVTRAMGTNSTPPSIRRANMPPFEYLPTSGEGPWSGRSAYLDARARRGGRSPTAELGRRLRTITDHSSPPKTRITQSRGSGVDVGGINSGIGRDSRQVLRSPRGPVGPRPRTRPRKLRGQADSRADPFEAGGLPFDPPAVPSCCRERGLRPPRLRRLRTARSNSRTLCPCSAHRAANSLPPGPAPMTTTDSGDRVCWRASVRARVRIRADPARIFEAFDLLAVDALVEPDAGPVGPVLPLPWRRSLGRPSSPGPWRPGRHARRPVPVSACSTSCTRPAYTTGRWVAASHPPAQGRPLEVFVPRDRDVARCTPVAAHVEAEVIDGSVRRERLDDRWHSSMPYPPSIISSRLSRSPSVNRRGAGLGFARRSRRATDVGSRNCPRIVFAEIGQR